MTKKKELELQLVAVELWWQTFGKPGMSDFLERLYMSKLLNELNEKIAKCK